MFERIVVAYDGSEPSRAAAQLAFRIAQACEAKVVLSQVVESTGGLPAHPQALADIEHQLHEREVECRDQLKALEKQVPPGTPVESSTLPAQCCWCETIRLLPIGST